MTKRWTESDLRFIKDNAEKMSVQGLADALDSRIDELERKMEKLGLTGAAGTPAAKKALTLKELSRHTENARKDFDRGIGALQKKRFDEAERNLLDRDTLAVNVAGIRAQRGLGRDECSSSRLRFGG